jgi:hypothetical protein
MHVQGSHQMRRPHIHKRPVPRLPRVPFHKRSASPPGVRSAPPTQGTLLPHCEHLSPVAQLPLALPPLSAPGGGLNVTLNGSSSVSLSVLPGGQILISLNGSDGKTAENSARCSLGDLNRQPPGNGMGQCTSAKRVDDSKCLISTTALGFSSIVEGDASATLSCPAATADPAGGDIAEDVGRPAELEDSRNGASAISLDGGADPRPNSDCETTTSAGLLEYLAGLRKYIDSIGMPPDGATPARSKPDLLPDSHDAAGVLSEGLPVTSPSGALCGGNISQGVVALTRDCLVGQDDERAEPPPSLRTRYVFGDNKNVFLMIITFLGMLFGIPCAIAFIRGCARLCHG